MLQPNELTESKIAALKSEHGSELSAVYARLGVLILRKPSRAAYDMWADKASKGEADSAAHRQLAISCLAGTTETELSEVLNDQPALLRNEITNAITSMAGLSKEEAEVKKL